jgi:hypothetical protein
MHQPTAEQLAALARADVAVAQAAADLAGAQARYTEATIALNRAIRTVVHGPSQSHHTDTTEHQRAG